MFPFLRLGPVLLQLPGLALLVGAGIGTSIAEKEAARLKIQAVDVANLIFYGLVAGLIGARLAYAARFFSTYLTHPLELFALTSVALDFNGGAMFGVVVAGLFGWRKQLPLRLTLDALAPGLAAFMVTLGLAHLLSGEAFGAPAQLPWSIYLWNAYRHPSQVYEILAALVVFIVAWKSPLRGMGAGLNFLLVVALSATAQIFLDAFRGDSVIWAGGFRAAQVIGLLVLGGCCWLMPRWAQARIPAAVQA